MANASKSTSLTFQSSQDKKEMLEESAFKRGYKRVVNGKEVGNMSLLINLAIDYMFDTEDDFNKWMTNKAKRNNAPLRI